MKVLIRTDKLSKYYGKRNGLSFRRMLPSLDPFVGLLCDHLLQTVIISLVGIVPLCLERRKLSRIE